MIQLALIDVILAEREREIVSAIRRRQLLKPVEDGDAIQPETRRTAAGRSLAIRTRASTG